MECAAIPQHLPTVWYPSVGIYAARQGQLGVRVQSLAPTATATTTTIPAALLYTKTADRSSLISGWRATPKRPSALSDTKFGRCRAHGTTCQPLTASSSCPAQNTPPGRCTPTENSITAELAGAYPPIPGLTTYRRCVSASEQSITLRDETDYPGTVDLTLLTEQQPAATADGFAVGTLGGIRFDPEKVTAAKVTPVPITDPRLRTAWPETIYRITLHFQKITECRAILRRTAMETIKLKILDEVGSHPDDLRCRHQRIPCLHQLLQAR